MRDNNKWFNRLYFKIILYRTAECSQELGAQGHGNGATHSSKLGTLLNSVTGNDGKFVS